jgi:putative DNA primase/helicase
VQVKEQARGNWLSILRSLGIQETFLKNKHGPCPMCGGKDRYRWDNKNGRGTYYCQCGPGDGFQLLMKFHNWTFPETAQRIEELLDGAILKQKIQPIENKTDARVAINIILGRAQSIKEGDPVSEYLLGRGLNHIPDTLLYHPELWESETKKTYPGMIIKVQSPRGEVISLHRTFLRNGRKAPIESPRKVLPPTETLRGSAIRLFPAHEYLGIAEGIETALAAHEMFKIPVWSVINANGVKTFEPPEGVKKVYIFGDNDESFTGQAASYEAAHRLTIKNFAVRVHLPNSAGWDWLDELSK